MARPEHIADIELDSVEFGTIELDKISTDAALLKGYTAFIEGAQKAGVTIISGNYGRVTFHRPPNLTEMQAQLDRAQSHWDIAKKYYEQLADLGECEYTYQRTSAEEWAKAEGLPFPPEHTPIDPIDAVIRDIDGVTV